MCACAHMYGGIFVDIRGHLEGVGSLSALCGSHRLVALVAVVFTHQAVSPGEPESGETSVGRRKILLTEDKHVLCFVREEVTTQKDTALSKENGVPAESLPRTRGSYVHLQPPEFPSCLCKTLSS